MTAKQTNHGALITAKHVASGTLTAGGAGDNTEVVGSKVDRLVPGGKAYLSAKLVIAGQATLAQAKVLTFAITQDEADTAAGSFSTPATVKAAHTVATGGTGGSTEDFCVEYDLDLSAAKRIVRHNITPNLDATATDVARWAATLVLCGADGQPVTASLV